MSWGLLRSAKPSPTTWQTRIVAAVRHCWTVPEYLGYDPEILHPEAVAWLAAVLTIPPDAMGERAPSDDPANDEPVD